jgi:hypothetical protein
MMRTLWLWFCIIHCIVNASEQSKLLQITVLPEEVNEILNSDQLYAYFGAEVCSLVYNLPVVYREMVQHDAPRDYVQLLCEYIEQGKSTAKADLIQKALEEAAEYLYQLSENEKDHLYLTDLKDYYIQFIAGTFDIQVHPSDNTVTKSSNKTKTYCSLDVKRKLLAGCLGVRGNACIGGNLTINGNETLHGTLTLLNTPLGSPDDLLLTINSAGLVTESSLPISGGFIINGCQPGPLTIGTSDSTTLTFVTECTDRMSINANGAVTIQTPEAGEIGLTIVGGGEEITAGDLNIVAGNIILPAATPGVATSVSNGLIEFGGANPSVTNVSEFNVGTRNFFEGNYATVPNVSGTDNIAFGTEANSLLTTANNTIAIGTTSLATATDSIAIGDGATATAARTIVVGSEDSTSTGAAPTALATNAIAIGSASGTMTGPIASGLSSVAVGSADATGTFDGALASGARSIAIGINANAIDAGTIAIGSASGTVGGTPPIASNISAIAIGSGHVARAGALASGISAIAIGGADGPGPVTSNYPGAIATGNRSIAIGGNSTSTADGTIAIGSASGVGSFGGRATAANGIAIGSASGATSGALASGIASIAIGSASGAVTGAVASGARSVAIGNGANTAQADAILLGNAAVTAVRVGIGIAAPLAKLDVVGANGVIVARLNQVNSAITNAPVWLNPSTSAVAGTPIHYNGANQLFGFTSSARYKTNIRSIDNESDAIYQLNPVLYDPKEGYGQGKDIPGFIAEEVYAVAPHLAILNNENQPENVAYNSLHALAIKEIQKQQQSIEEQKKLIEEQEILINNLLKFVEYFTEKMNVLEKNVPLS